jgi:hypothetical protein
MDHAQAELAVAGRRTLDQPRRDDAVGRSRENGARSAGVLRHRERAVADRRQPVPPPPAEPWNVVGPSVMVAAPALAGSAAVAAVAAVAAAASAIPAARIFVVGTRVPLFGTDGGVGNRSRRTDAGKGTQGLNSLHPSAFRVAVGFHGNATRAGRHG